MIDLKVTRVYNGLPQSVVIEFIKFSVYFALELVKLLCALGFKWQSLRLGY